MEKDYTILEEYKKVFERPEILEINKLLDSGAKEKVSDKIDALEHKIEASIKQFIPEEYTQLKTPIDEYTQYRKSKSWGLIELSKKSIGHYGDNTNYTLNNMENSKELVKQLDEKIALLITQYKRIKPYTNGTIHKTRYPLGIIDNTIKKFCECPARTHDKSPLNLIIETSTYSTSMRIPALHYWKIPDGVYKEQQTKRQNLNVLKVIYYKEMKDQIIKHNADTKVKIKIIQNTIKSVNKKITPYFVLASI